jgi:hypothetical protein
MDDDADAELEEGEACGNDTAFVRGPGNARGSRRPAGKPERRLLARRRDSGSAGAGSSFRSCSDDVLINFYMPRALTRSFTAWEGPAVGSDGDSDVQVLGVVRLARVADDDLDEADEGEVDDEARDEAGQEWGTDPDAFAGEAERDAFLRRRHGTWSSTRRRGGGRRRGRGRRWGGG